MIFIFNIREVVVSFVQKYYNIINFEKKMRVIQISQTAMFLSTAVFA